MTYLKTFQPVTEVTTYSQALLKWLQSNSIWFLQSKKHWISSRHFTMLLLKCCLVY